MRRHYEHEWQRPHAEVLARLRDMTDVRCATCGRTFRSLAGLKTHRRRHHMSRT